VVFRRICAPADKNKTALENNSRAVLRLSKDLNFNYGFGVVAAGAASIKVADFTNVVFG